MTLTAPTPGADVEADVLATLGELAAGDTAAGRVPDAGVDELARLRHRALWLRLVLGWSVGMALIALTAGLVAYATNAQFFAGERSGLSSLAADDRLVSAVLVLLGGDLLVAALWSRWCRAGLAVASPGTTESVRPLARPRATVAVLWRGVGDSPERAAGEGLVTAWWALLVLTVAVAVISELVFPRGAAAESLNRWEWYYRVMLVAIVLHGAAAQLTSVLARRTTDALIAAAHVSSGRRRAARSLRGVRA